MITIQRQSDYTAADEGYYEANVTNALGWNISKKYVRILCELNDCYGYDSYMDMHCAPVQCLVFLQAPLALKDCHDCLPPYGHTLDVSL